MLTNQEINDILRFTRANPDDLQINLGNQYVLVPKHAGEKARRGNLKGTMRIVYNVRFVGSKPIGYVRRGFVEFDPVAARPFWKPSETPPP